MQNDEDDDICPVCESDCTCSSSARPPAPPPPPHPLKIRLTVPPSLFSSLQAQTPHDRSARSTTSVSAPDGGQPQPPAKRKRGRPTKAEAEARRAAALALETQEQISRVQQARKVGTAPKGLKSPKSPRKVSSRQHKRTESIKEQIQLYGGTSTELDSEADGPSLYPAFVSKISSDSDEGKHADGFDSSELSSVPDPGDDSTLEEEEERYVIQQAVQHDKARVKRELFGNDGQQRKSIRRKRDNYESRPRRRRTSDKTATPETESGSDDHAEDEEGADADGEADGEADDDTDGYPQMVGADLLSAGAAIWSESDEENLDIDVFFASLSGSDTSTEFEHVFQVNQADDDDFSDDAQHRQMDDTGAAGLLSLSSTDSATVLVSKDWNGQPIFTNGSDLAMGMLDIDFELNVVAQHQAAAQASEEPSMIGPGDEDSEMWIHSDDNDQYDSDHGDTTDEDTSVLRGVQTASGVVMFRFPTPPISSIDPLSTLSPATKKRSSSRVHKRFERTPKHLPTAPKPAELLARRGSAVPSEMNGDNDNMSVGGKSSSISSSGRYPIMGAFSKDGGPAMQHVIINGKSTNIPPPLGTFERQRRGSSASRGRKRGAARSRSPFPVSPKRQCQSPFSSRSHSRETRASRSFDHSPARAPLMAPMALDDVLDSSLLETNENEPRPGDMEGNRFFVLWERVPMGAYRTRNPEQPSNELASIMEWAPNQPAPVSDGFSYGSSGGTLMRSGPLFRPQMHGTWEDENMFSSTDTLSPSSHITTATPGPGDRTPRPGDQSPTFGNSPADPPIPRVLSHKQRRKERQKHAELNPLTSISAY